MNIRSFTFLFFLLIASIATYAQNATLFGKVSSSQGQPVSAISISLQDTRLVAFTDDNGEYRLQHIKPGAYTVNVSFAGKLQKSESVTFAAGDNKQLDVTISSGARELDEVVVETSKIMNRAAATANKIPLSSLETPQIVHSISNVILRKQNAMTLEDAMKNAPGVAKLWDATSRPDGGSIFVSRGFQVTTKVRNGLPNIVNTNVEMANLERIEIIKGPSATMFGSIVSSYGGLINRVTKRPYFDNGGYADVSYGSFNFYRASADANFVIKKDKIAARLNVAGQNQDSWQDAGFQQSYIIAPSFLYKPNDKFTLNVDAEIVGSKGNSNGGNFMFVLAPSQINGALAGVLAAQGLNQQQIAGILSQAPQTFKQAFGTDKVDELKLDYNRSFLHNDVYPKTQSNAYFADATYKLSQHWTSQTAFTYSLSHNSGYSAYQYIIPNYLPAFIGSISTGTPSFGTPGTDSMARMVWNPIGSTNTINAQQNFVSDYQWGKVRNRAVIGVDYARYNSLVTYRRFTGSLFGVPYADVFDIVPSNGNSPKMGDFNKENVENAFAARPPSELVYDQRSEVWSGYVNNVTNITDYVIVSAGVRVDNFKNRVSDEDQTKWSPKFGLIIMPIKDVLTIFANYQNSFTNQFGADRNNVPFDPEEANQKEVGVKYSFFKNKLTGSLSVYDILAKNVLRADPVNPQFQIQDGEQKSKGFEAEIVANPYTGWTILFGYAYNDSRYVRADANVEGLRPVGSGPLNMANFWTNYTFTTTKLKGLGIGVSLNYSGESNAFNQKPDGALILPSYAILGSHVTYDMKRFRLGVKVNNITNEQYWMGWSSIIPQMKRQLIGTLTVKF
ncbi:TonB-dependent receptor [Chitinophaga horti]|uniref:TonB-dependent receptor n=1 Tax=Chitinophaga horti TaxID=2920382 RepID=A0ABY6IUW3_9BACT|nr:TonB-dependent receptor [Chitinophaga horti]UYQ91146.1 TonB-dependent receptor [Chitinophaga horti]